MRTHFHALGVRLCLFLVACGGAPVFAGPLFALAEARLEGDGSGIGFGFSVDIDADRLVVGAPDEFTPTRRGAVYVFERVGGVWGRVAKLQAEEIAPLTSFGHAVDLDGDRLLVGAPGRLAEGVAYVFELVDGRWIQTARFSGEGIGSRPRFGSAVALRANTAVIGMPDALDPDGGAPVGAAVVYTRDGLAWERTAVLSPPASERAAVGDDVVIAGTTIAVGAPDHDGVGESSGAVYVYEQVGDDWQLLQSLAAPDAASGARFGAELALDGDFLLVQAEGLPAVYTFDRSGGLWDDGERLATLIPDSDFGAGLAIEDDVVVLGAPRAGDTEGEGALLARVNGAWDPQSLLPPDFTRTSAFGGAVAISRDRVVVGDATDDAEGGGVYVYGLQICREPVEILTQPEDVFGCPGDTVSLTVEASGTGLNYRWRKDGVQLADDGRITGTSTATMTIAGLLEEDDGLYDVVVGNGCSEEVSFDAEVSPARVTGNPTSILRCSGASATFSCAVDALDPQYQWERDGIPLVDDDRISGSQTNLLTILDTSDVDEGSYACRIFTCTELLTTSAILTVTNSPDIITQPITTSVCAGYPASFTIEAAGDQLTYQWSRGFIELTDGGKYAGTRTPTLSINPTSGNDSAEYRCSVFNHCGGIFTDTVRLYIAGFPPMIAADPEDVTVGVGGVIFLVVEVEGFPVLYNYQWFKDGVPLADDDRTFGSLTQTLVILNAQAGDAADYTCEVSISGAECPVTSGPGTVTIVE